MSYSPNKSMSHRLHDPSLDVVRSGFLDSLSRFCLLLALANFSAIAPLFFMYAYQQAANELFIHYTTLLTAVGIILTVLGVLCRYQNLAELVAKLCVALLFAQACFLIYYIGTLEHPVMMMFPILCFVVTPILGLRSSYGVAAASLVVLGIIDFTFLKSAAPLGTIAGHVLIFLAILFCAHASFLLWRGVLRREATLKAVVNDLRKESEEVNAWASRLASTSRLISEGGYSQQMPDEPPSDAFKELSQSINEMQKKLGSYFAETLLKDRLNSIGLLASGLAHELNTPLTSMQFMIQGSKLPEPIAQSLAEEIERMGKITREFLNFASPHQADETIELNEIIRASLSLFRRMPGKSPEIVSKLCNTPLTIHLVKNQMQQILLNLYKNSLDSMNAVAFPKFEIQTMQDGNVAVLTMSDNGSGIPPEILSKVFDPFFSTKSQGSGFGLGLYIVQQIVQMHHGEIKMESTPGLGTKVSLRFPIDGVEQRKAA